MGLDEDLMRQSVDLLILLSVSEERTYGYRLLNRIREQSGLATLNAGTLYPALHRLEALGLIGSTWDRRTRRPRKWYHLTESGRSMLTTQASQWQKYVDSLRKDLEPILANLVARPSPAVE